MTHTRTPLASAILSVLLLTLHGGCRPEKPREANSADSGKEDAKDNTSGKHPQYGEVFQVDERFTLSDGKRDLQNRYSSTVTTEITTSTGETVACSGVVIGPRLVLTAGHCVCIRHEATTPEDGVESIIDNKQCAKVARVTTELYNLQTRNPDSIRDKQFHTHTGRLHPHPGLKLLLNRQAAAISSTADLAIIILDTPVGGEVPAIQFASTDVRAGESIIMVGYGHDSISDLIYGIRRFGMKKVTGFSNPGTVLFEQQGADFTSGSGEPCLRIIDNDMFLVGITSKDIDGRPAFTSTFLHQVWLKTEIENASKSISHGPP